MSQPRENQVGRRTTQFDELVVASELTEFSINSMWGDIEFRNDTETAGSGTITSTSDGEIRISSGTTAGSTANLVSNQAGVYEPGTSAVLGIGARMGQIPSGDEEYRWGAYDDQNGFYFGYDSGGLHIGIRRNGTDTKTYRQDFNYDSVDGSGPSGLNLSLSDTVIYQIEFTHYGAGPISFWVVRRTHDYLSQKSNKQLVHVYDPYPDEAVTGPSIPQPNLPFTSEVDNGTTTNDAELYVTGRSFNVISGDRSVETRTISDLLTGYQLTAAQGVWEPILAFQKKDTFNGFPNQVNVRPESFRAFSDEECDFRSTINGALDDANTTFSTPTDYNANWTCVEVARAGVGDGVTVSTLGRPTAYSLVRGTNVQGNQTRAVGEGSALQNFIGRNQPVVIWARPTTVNTTTVDLTVSWTETH